MISGKMEQENKLQERIEDKLKNLPEIFTEFYNYMEADDKSYSTCLYYIEYVSDFMDYIVDKNDCDKDSFYKNITVQEIRAYVTSLRRRIEKGQEVKNGDSIQGARFSAVNAFFNFLVMDDYIDTNPMNKVKRPKNKTQKEIVYLEKDEIDSIINKIKKEANDKMIHRDIALVVLGITTGLRVSALLNINVSDINWVTNELITIEKGNKTRTIKFGDKTKSALAQWIMDRNNYFGEIETDALFISQWKQRLTREGARKLFNKYTSSIDKHVTLHTMRKSCATNAYLAGADIRTIASALGHNSIQTTMKYAAAVDDKRDAMVNSLDSMFDCD